MRENEQEVESGVEEGGAASLEDGAESRWLRAKQTDPDAPPPSTEIVREHAELEEMLGILPALRLDDTWHDEVLRAAARARRRESLKRWSWVAGSALAAAAIVAIALMPGKPASTGRPELDVEIRPGTRAMPRGSSPTRANLGDLLVVTARVGTANARRVHRAAPPSWRPIVEHMFGAVGALRVYRADRTLVARCPDGPHCISPSVNSPEQKIELILDAPVQYRAVLVVGTDLKMLGEPLDAYLEAAANSGARIFISRPIDVR